MSGLSIGDEYWKNKIVNCLGDSITYGVNNSGISWADMLPELIPFHKVRKYGVSGSSVSLMPQRRDSFFERFRQMEMDYDLTIIFGGINDFNHSLPLGEMGDRGGNTFYGALNEIIAGLTELNPKGEIMCITPMKGHFQSKGYPHWDTNNEEGYRLTDYRCAVLNVAGYYSVPVLDLYSFSGLSPDCITHREFFLSDGLHPTEAGYERIARKIASFISQI